MPFMVKATYLMHEYTYCVSTEDQRRFVCTRQSSTEGEEAGAPPETIALTLGEEPKAEVWGKSLAGLYRELAGKITEHIHKAPGK